MKIKQEKTRKNKKKQETRKTRKNKKKNKKKQEMQPAHINYTLSGPKSGIQNLQRDIFL